MCRGASFVAVCTVVFAIGMHFGSMNVVRVAYTRDQRALFRGLTAVYRDIPGHLQDIRHMCSATLISHQLVMTTPSCRDGAGNLLDMDVLNPEEISYFNASSGNSRQTARKDEAPRFQESSTGTLNAILMKLPLPVDTPLPNFESSSGDVGCLECIQGGGRINDGENIEVDIVPGDTVFIPDAWRPGEYRMMRVGGLEACGGAWGGGANVMCATWKGPAMSAISVGGPVYKRKSAKGLVAYVIAGVVTHVGEASEGSQNIAIINISSELDRFRRAIDQQNLWLNVSPERLPAFTLILGKDGTSSQTCKGMLIKERFVLTAAHCVNQLGTNPLVVVGAKNIDGPYFGDGQQMLRVESAHTHPNWNGRTQDGFDIALLKLPRRLKVASPTLADVKRWGVTNYTDPNAVAYGFRLGAVLEGILFDVVMDRACPEMGILASHMFCAHRHGAKLKSGCSGGPILLIEGGINDGDDPRNDLLVGVVSCTNYSGEYSGVGCVEVSDVIEWIRGVIELPNFYSSWEMHWHVYRGAMGIICFMGFPFIILNPMTPWKGVWRFCFCCIIAAAAIISISDLGNILEEHLKTAGPPRLLCAYAMVLGAMTHLMAIELWDPGTRAALQQILANFVKMLASFFITIPASGNP